MSEACTAWSPGLESDIPAAYRVLETIYNLRNVSSTIEQIDELSGLTGLGPAELVAFRPARLALHETIVRVSGEILVEEGEDETALGRNFRRIAQDIWRGYIVPELDEIERAYADLRSEAMHRVVQELHDHLYTPQPPAQPDARGIRAWFARARSKPRVRQAESIETRESRALAHFKQQGLAASDPFGNALYRSLYRVLGSLVAHRGFIGPERETIAGLVCNHLCNGHGSELIGERVTAPIQRAIAEHGYTTIRASDTPVLISLKGPSAAGKSSLRPMLKRTMRERGMDADGYITISPDIWRRLLLDYEALGAAYKYAGRLTSHELLIIDGKLDQYIRDKADRLHTMPHLLVDRFRFDSFSTERIAQILHGTYVRHVQTLFMYFVITPPAETVERGWQRGLETGRYKAVEDFLDHSVEAYGGMPRVLFKWLGYQSPLFHYRFLDNSVPKGTFPRTAAYGDQQSMTILDCRILVDIERYQKINIHARSAAEIYPPGARLDAVDNLGFLRQCLKRIPLITFVDAPTDRPYLEIAGARVNVLDAELLDARLAQREERSILTGLVPQLGAAASTPE
jgi:hypothetical protein